MKYESEGLFIGLVSFPFYVDGKELYEKVFLNFFREHHCQQFLEQLSEKKLNETLYAPTAYRMFGNHGLAILSLIDDYAFCSRIFNSGHIRIPKGCESINKYKSVVLAGSSEDFGDTDRCLTEVASKTFLSDGKGEIQRYPLIGIIRIKLDYRLLRNNGAYFTRSIKRRIERLKTELENKQKEHRKGSVPFHLESITLDAYDNDELIVVAFSNSFRTLDSFLKDIRRIQLKDLDIANEDDFDREDLQQIWHVCASSHMSYGYHIDFSFTSSGDPTFLAWDRENDCKEDGKDLIYEINCLIETKPGHRNSFCNYLTSVAKSHFDISEFDLNKTVTGGSIVHIRIPLEKVQVLHEMTRGKISDGEYGQGGVFRRDIRRIKLTLNDNRGPSKGKEGGMHHCLLDNKNLIGQDKIDMIKRSLTHLGVSKIVRERLLSLLDVYNDCGRSKLQQYYFMQLQPAVENIAKILQDFDENINESLLDIELRLNEEISALETAFYNRMHNKMNPNAILEYGGGVQQFLQAFGFAYKEIVRVTSPSEASKNYSLITGVCKEASMRTHAELNINHILYPQLFCVTTWKEASNFTLQLLDEYDWKGERENWEFYQEKKAYYDLFRSLIRNKSAMNRVIEQMLSQTDIVRTDPVYSILYELLTPEYLKYSFQDYMLYHFTFNRDFRLMWRYYMKVFLQTPSVYRRKGEIKRKAFYLLLLRLFLVAFRENDRALSDDIKCFIQTQRQAPFDHQLAWIWFECFEKIEKASENLCMNLKSYAYSVVSEDMIKNAEYSMVNYHLYRDMYADYLLDCLADLTMPNEELVQELRKARKKNIDLCVRQIEDTGYLDIDTFMSGHPFSPDNTITLLNAFLIVIDHLDQKDKDGIKIHTLPRNNEGDIDFDLVKKLAPNSSNLLADPIGGFVIPDHDIRKKYNAYRTLLYRTLWDMSYVSSAFIYDLPEEN